MTEPDEQPAYELVMPFVVVTSKGGPYDDEAFTAGWQCAELDRDLAEAAALGATGLARTVRTQSVPQVDLIAMKHGFSARVEPWGEAPDEWSVAGFTAVSGEEQGDD